MEKSNEIALQLKNSFTEAISIALFPNVNNSDFVKSQTQNQVEAQYYNVGSTFYGLDGSIQIIQRNKITNESVFLDIPYTGTPEGSGVFDPDEFVAFCNQWFPANNYGYVYGNSAPDMTIYSDLYEYGNLVVPEA